MSTCGCVRRAVTSARVRPTHRRLGVYAAAPAGRYVWGGYYEPGSLIWSSRWVTGGRARARRTADGLALADSSVADAGRNGLHPSGRWQRADDAPALDAARCHPTTRAPYGLFRRTWRS